ncbi:uncharacterized protein LODBEIA_P08440 [Lodderomyces beijingensis]|uniref:t-SNARE coiled-coil homology domain-containing protein n=1 Tax=Lodderomyces beijingensis TaxID=1775926 RepID=A0ABP0ZHJ2_9ASCO
MSITTKEVRLKLSKLQLLIEELEVAAEERRNLQTLSLTPSANDDDELTSSLGKIVETFTFFESNLNINNKDAAIRDQFGDLVESYAKVYSQLESDPAVDVSPYKFSRKHAGKPQLSTPKSVRFKELPEENEDVPVMPAAAAMSKPFQPYHDDPPSNGPAAASESETETDNEMDALHDLSNHQMYAQHQQTMMRQDADLDLLHESVRRQNLMSHDIDDELDEHLVILNDLERGVDDSGFRLERATQRLQTFRQMARENGSLVTIIILSIILLLLLTVLN